MTYLIFISLGSVEERSGINTDIKGTGHDETSFVQVFTGVSEIVSTVIALLGSFAPTPRVMNTISCESHEVDSVFKILLALSYAVSTV